MMQYHFRHTQTNGQTLETIVNADTDLTAFTKWCQNPLVQDLPPHEGDKVSISIGEAPDQFKLGAKAMFDVLLARMANNWHGSPAMQEQCDRFNEILTGWLEDAIEDLDPNTFVAYQSLNFMYRLGLEKGKSRAPLDLSEVRRQALRDVVSRYDKDERRGLYNELIRALT